MVSAFKLYLNVVDIHLGLVMVPQEYFDFSFQLATGEGALPDAPNFDIDVFVDDALASLKQRVDVKRSQFLS